MSFIGRVTDERGLLGRSRVTTRNAGSDEALVVDVPPASPAPFPR